MLNSIFNVIANVGMQFRFPFKFTYSENKENDSFVLGNEEKKVVTIETHIRQMLWCRIISRSILHLVAFKYKRKLRKNDEVNRVESLC